VLEVSRGQKNRSEDSEDSEDIGDIGDIAETKWKIDMQIMNRENDVEKILKI